MSKEAAITSHYSIYSNSEAILSALVASGIDVEHLRPEDLTPFDQLHTSGNAATTTLIGLLAPQAGGRVLDVGCGLGGPARLLAKACACHVTGLDLTPHFIEAARDFTRRTRQTQHLDFHIGSATTIPFSDATFDAAWHIHMSMNVADKPAMYAEIFRVLKRGGRFALYDPILGDNADVMYPVPWALTPDTSFLLKQGDMVATIESAGFRTLQLTDATQVGTAWFADRAKAQAANPSMPRPTQDPRFAEMSRNHHNNLQTGTVKILCGLFEKP